MEKYTNEQLTEFVLQQERNFEKTARSGGYAGKVAKDNLAIIQATPMAQRLADAREQMENFSLASL